MCKENHRINSEGIVERRCTKCREWKIENDIYFYHINKKKSLVKFKPECKVCSGVRSRTLILAHPERTKAYDAKHNAGPKRAITYRKSNLKKRANGYNKEYDRRPEVKARKYASRHKNHDISKTEWIACKDYFKDDEGNQVCAYCGKKIQDHYRIFADELQKVDFHKEHVYDKGGNDLRNCIPSCKDCNSFKWSFDFEKWYRRQEFFTEERYDKIIQWMTEDYKDYIEEKLPYIIKRKQNEDGRTFHYELWTVDEVRNRVECIDIGDKKKDLNLELIVNT